MSASTARFDWQDIVRGARVNFLGILARSFRAVYLIFVARLFGAEVLGLFLLSWGVIDLLSKAGLVGLDRAVVRFLPPTRSGLPRGRVLLQILRTAVVTCSLTAVGVFLAAPALAATVLGQPAARVPLQILSWGIVPLVLTSVLLAVTRVERKMQYDVVTKSVIEPGLLLLVAVVLADRWADGTGLYVAQVAALGAGLLTAVAIVCRLGLVSPKSLPEAVSHQPVDGALGVRVLAAFALPIAVYDLIALGVMSLDFFVLARFASPFELGVYGAAVQIAIVVKKARQSFEPILLPVLSQQLARDEVAAARDALDRVSQRILALDLGFLLLITAFGPEILRLFGDGFEIGAPVLVLLTLAHSLNGCWGVAENVALLRRPEWNLWIWLAALPLAVGIHGSVIPRYGLVGAALGTVAIVGVVVGARLWQARRLIGWTPSFGFATRTAAVAGVLAVVAVGLKTAGPDLVVFRVLLAVATLAVYGWVVRGAFLAPPVNRPANGV